MSLRFRIALASACALLAVMLCVSYADGVRADAERVRSEALERFGGDVTKLVVATEGLEPGDVVDRMNASERDWVSDLAPEGALTSMDDAVGRELSVAVPKGAPLTELHFREGETFVDVPSGHVALTIPITDKLGVSRSIERGTALVGYAVTGEGARLISDDMTVLSDAVATTTSLGATPQLTVSVAPEDVPGVLDASATGDLRLVVPAHDVDMVPEVRGEAPMVLSPTDDDVMFEGDDAA